jgi:hypothetical protein
MLRERYGAAIQQSQLLWRVSEEMSRLRQQRCLEVASRPAHVSFVDWTRRTYRHHGRQRGAPRRIATFHHATLRVAPHRYATREPPGYTGGSRAFSQDDPTQAPKRLYPRDVTALGGDAMRGLADKAEFVPRKDDDIAEGASSSQNRPDSLAEVRHASHRNEGSRL